MEYLGQPLVPIQTGLTASPLAFWLNLSLSGRARWSLWHLLVRRKCSDKLWTMLLHVNDPAWKHDVKQTNQNQGTCVHSFLLWNKCWNNEILAKYWRYSTDIFLVWWCGFYHQVLVFFSLHIWKKTNLPLARGCLIFSEVFNNFFYCISIFDFFRF